MIVPHWIALGFSILLSVTTLTAEQLIAARVVGVHDGDTLTVLVDRTQVKVRLYGIDAPELGQPFGRNAKGALSERVHGQTVTVDVIDTDRYGRTVGRIRMGNRDINLELVEAGMAWWYRQYSPSNAKLEQAEAVATKEKRGLWADHDPIPPWKWRAEKRKHPATTSTRNEMR